MNKKSFTEDFKSRNESWGKTWAPAIRDCFFNDVVFVVLPLAVIIFLRYALNNSLGNIFLMPEWSFAAIILYGTDITYFLELKVAYQGDYSFKFYQGTRIHILLIIASVIILALTILSEQGLNISHGLIQWAQALLFVSSIMLVLFSYQAKHEASYILSTLPTHITKRDYFLSLSKDIEEANEKLEHLLFALDKRPSLQLKTTNELIRSAEWEEARRLEIKDSVNNLDRKLSFIKEKINPRSDSA